MRWYKKFLGPIKFVLLKFKKIEKGCPELNM